MKKALLACVLTLSAMTSAASEGIMPKNRSIRGHGGQARTRAVTATHLPSATASGGRAASAPRAQDASTRSTAYRGSPSETARVVFRGGRVLSRGSDAGALSYHAKPRMLSGGSGVADVAAASAPGALIRPAAPIVETAAGASITGGGSSSIQVNAGRSTPATGMGAFAGQKDKAPWPNGSDGDAGPLDKILKGLSDMFGSMAQMLGGK